MICNEYDDKTPMPFGKHIGTSLANVPADYLIYLWDTSAQGERLSNAKLAKYIKDNLSGLKMEVIAQKQRRRYERR